MKALAAQVERVADAWAKRAPGAVVAAVDLRSDEEAVRGVGRLRLPDGATPDARSLFEIGSVSKVFTGLLLADAVVRGEVRTDTPVAELLPGVAVPERDGRPILLEHLAAHRSGLPSSPVPALQAVRVALLQRRNPYAGVTPQRLLEVVETARLRRPPGTGGMHYSNLGMALLGEALVRRTGAASYGALIAERIAGPLGLADTCVLDDIGDRRERLATGYAGRRPKEAEHWRLTGMAGAGALLSNAADLIRFLRAQLQPESSPLADAIALSHVQRHDQGRFGIGLGWIRSTLRDGVLLWHNGGTGGFRSFVGFRADAGVGAVVLSSGRRGPDRRAVALLSALAEH